jgi:Protein of unknown function (DUF1329)
LNTKLFALFFFFLSSASAAEDLGEKQVGSVQIVSSENVKQYKQFLLEPIFKLIAERKLLFRTVPNLNYSWQFSPSWEVATQQNAAHFSVNEEGELKIDNQVQFARGLPFLLETEIESEKNEIIKSKKILWNVLAAQAVGKFIAKDIEFTWHGQQGVQRTASGSLLQSWQEVGGQVEQQVKPDVPQEPSKVFLEELVSLRSPPAIMGYSQLFKSYLGGVEDQLIMHSPVFGKDREVSISNRCDPFLDGIMRGDDFSVWSSNPQSVSSRVVVEKTLLVAFHSADPAIAEDLVYKGSWQTDSGNPSTVVWNFKSHQFTGFPSWNPTSAVFVPRKTWIIEIWTKNPYLGNGREILVIDKESFLPVYRLVYDFKGEVKRAVIGGWGLVFGKTPFLSFVISVDESGNNATTYGTNSVRLFSNSKELFETIPQEQKTAEPKIAEDQPPETT